MIYKKIKLEDKQKIFFTSDTHYGHKNICRGTSTWNMTRSGKGGIDKIRDFDTLEEMNAALVKGINDYVGQDDYLVFLGDWSFGGEENIWNFRKRIICNNIIFILGNHDHHIANNRILSNVTLDECTRFYPETNIITGELNSMEKINPHAHTLFYSVDSYSELTVSSSKYGKHTYVLFHFPISVWNKAHHGRIHLYGHSHDSFKGEGKILDVGVDTAFRMFKEYRPFTESEVLDIMVDKKFVTKDHHNKNTN